MREFTKSAFSFSWAMSLFGAQQMINLFRPGKVVDSFEHVTSATEGQLGQSLQALFQTGDEIQRRILDMLLGASSLNGSAATSGSNRPAPVSASPGLAAPNASRPGSSAGAVRMECDARLRKCSDTTCCRC